MENTSGRDVATLPKRIVLIREGHRPAYVFAILEGTAELVKDNDSVTPQQVKRLQGGD